MGPLKNKDFYFAQEVADEFGISKKTLFEWERQGKISRPPKDWRGWRMYKDNHLRQIKRVIDEKKRVTSERSAR